MIDGFIVWAALRIAEQACRVIDACERVRRWVP